MRPQPIPTWLEDAAEAVGRLLRTDDEIMQTTDIVEQTGLPAHRVSSALKLLVDLGVVERRGQRESSLNTSIINLLPGGQLQPRVTWSTQFYYWWVAGSAAAEEQAEAKMEDSGGPNAYPSHSAAAPPATRRSK